MEWKKREIWIDNVKVVSCLLVTIGHFFQSMVKSGIVPGNDLYLWFDQTIYYFHVPLFFICSGYLYQQYTIVDSVRSWRKNASKKMLVLGVPYVAFSTVTWLLKTVFSGAVNNQAGGLFETLLLAPTSPYWFLYALFFIFLITPTFSGRGMAGVVCAVAAFLKVISMFGKNTGIYAVDRVMSYEIWFVLGMVISATSFAQKVRKKGGKAAGGLLFAVVLLLSAGVYAGKFSVPGIGFWMGLLACAAITVFFMAAFRDCRQHWLFGFLANYTMPIFLMHTIFAAPFRTMLFKMGIENGWIHVIFGLFISIGGPIIAAEIMKQFKWMDFFLYPSKYLKAKKLEGFSWQKKS